MLTEERQHYILDLIYRQRSIKLKDLTTSLNASESTIRRDLDDLEKRGLLKRVHGGAVSLNGQFTHDHTIPERSGQFTDEKRLIGQFCASLVKDGDFIYLDSGTTTYEIIPFLKGKNISVLTNGIHNLERLIEYDIPSFMLGGKIKPLTKTIIGESALLNLESYRFSKAFIGANGISFHSEVTTPDISEATLKRKALTLAAVPYIVADSSKFDNISYAKICDLREAGIITNASKDKIDRRILTKTEILFAAQ